MFIVIEIINVWAIGWWLLNSFNPKDWLIWLIESVVKLPGKYVKKYGM